MYPEVDLKVASATHQVQIRISQDVNGCLRHENRWSFQLRLGICKRDKPTVERGKIYARMQNPHSEKSTQATHPHADIN